jgi:hypothetical protein
MDNLYYRYTEVYWESIHADWISATYGIVHVYVTTCCLE